MEHNMKRQWFGGSRSRGTQKQARHDVMASGPGTRLKNRWYFSVLLFHQFLLWLNLSSFQFLGQFSRLQLGKYHICVLWAENAELMLAAHNSYVDLQPVGMGAFGLVW
jgi:hypothetical protein